jgi:WD repeat-containing protein mio
MSGMLTALIHSNSRNSELRDHCARLMVRLQDPYFRAMLTLLNSGDWSEVLEEEALPLRERLAIAIQFLDDHALTSFFRSIVKRSCDEGNIEGLIVTGLTPLGLGVLQSYVDHTGDVQTASMLASYVCPAKFDDKRVHRWLDSYRDLLDGFKLFHHRVRFDVERGQILKDAVQRGDIPSADWAPPQISIRCNYCNKAMNAPGAAPPQSHRVSCIL